MRIGIGYDVHRLAEGRKLVLGGVDIPFEKGLLGHSDADALTHAIMDALLGAAGLGDIGQMFPDTDPKYKDISSLTLLKIVKNVCAGKNWDIVNVDSVIVAQHPKLSPYFSAFRANIAEALDIDIECVNIKATTEEGLGFTGTGEGIAAKAVCLLESRRRS